MRPRRRRYGLLPRPDWRASPAERAHPAGRPWFRKRRPKEPREVDKGDRRRRALAVGLALIELALLAALLVSPAFQIRQVDVLGARHLSAAQVRQLAGLSHPGSIFLLDGDQVRQRLEASTWVRSAAVGVRLPGQVTLTVDEWRPVATYRAGDGSPWYLSDQAVALSQVAPKAAQAGLVEIDGPAKPAPAEGRQVLDLQLLVALVNIQRALPGLIGEQAKSFQVDGCGNLTMTAGRGWKVQFGRVLTPEEFSSLRDKVAALKSIQPYVDYNSPDLVYVNVMNPSQPAVQDRSAQPQPSPSPKPGASPGPSAPVVVQQGPVVTATPCR